MDEPPTPEPSLRPPPSSPGALRSGEEGSRGWERFKKALGPLGGVLVLIVSFFGKLKFLIPVLLKTGGTMILSIWAYALFYRWWFAVGFVVLILVHECGHAIAARLFGIKVTAPVFIPFLGAGVLLKDRPRNAWIDACVSIGGPMLGAIGGGVCVVLGMFTGNELFDALAYTTFLLNLFNLTPVAMLDGGRIVTALSPWLWLAGLVILGAMLFQSLNPILVLLLALSLPGLFSLFRAKTDAEKSFLEITSEKRWTMAGMYFGLVAVLVFGMHVTHTAAGVR